MKNLVFVLFAMLFCSHSIAQSQAPMGARNRAYGLGTLVSAAAMSASSTVTLTAGTPEGYGLATLYIKVLDADNSVSAVTMSCAGSPDANTTSYTLQTGTTAAGVFTSVDASWTKNPSSITSPKTWIWRVDIEGIKDVVCTITNTGGAAADKLTVTASVAVKGS